MDDNRVGGSAWSCGRSGPATLREWLGGQSRCDCSHADHHHDWCSQRVCQSYSTGDNDVPMGASGGSFEFWLGGELLGDFITNGRGTTGSCRGPLGFVLARYRCRFKGPSAGPNAFAGRGADGEFDFSALADCSVTAYQRRIERYKRSRIEFYSWFVSINLGCPYYAKFDRDEPHRVVSFAHFVSRGAAGSKCAHP